MDYRRVGWERQTGKSSIPAGFLPGSSSGMTGAAPPRPLNEDCGRVSIDGNSSLRRTGRLRTAKPLPATRHQCVAGGFTDAGAAGLAAVTCGCGGTPDFTL